MRNLRQVEKNFSAVVYLKNKEERASDIKQKTLAVDDLDSVAKIHIEAFPASAWTKLGSQVVKNYYHWQITGPHPFVTAKAVYVDGDCAGFLVAGLFRDSTSGFIRLNRNLLARKILLKPWLLHNPEFRESVYRGYQILKNFMRRKKTEQKKRVSENNESKSYGILAIAVSPRYQGCGIGKILMETAESTALASDFEKMDLSVNPSNTQAIKFYERLNWKRVSKNGVWKGVMEKTLMKAI